MTGVERTAYFLKYAPDIYGRYWKTNIALHLGVNTNTIRNWSKGLTHPSLSVLMLLQVYADHGYRYYRAGNNVQKGRNDDRSL